MADGEDAMRVLMIATSSTPTWPPPHSMVAACPIPWPTATVTAITSRSLYGTKGAALTSTRWWTASRSKSRQVVLRQVEHHRPDSRLHLLLHRGHVSGDHPAPARCGDLLHDPALHRPQWLDPAAAQEDSVRLLGDGPLPDLPIACGVVKERSSTSSSRGSTDGASNEPMSTWSSADACGTA